jgi:CheY-like chemotaxis protein
MGGAAGPDFKAHDEDREREMTQTLEGRTADGRPFERRDPARLGGGADRGERIGTGGGRPGGGRALAPTASVSALDEPTGRAAQRSGSVGVLVVDDSLIFRTGMARAVKACSGLELLGEADNGYAALDAIAELEPDIVILDLRMPELDGIGVLRSLRAQDPPPACRVLVISATLDEESESEILEAGAHACLSKALSRADICDVVLRLAAP